MQMTQGKLVTTHAEINKVFRSFYTNLYSKGEVLGVAESLFFKDIQTPSLTTEQLETLNAPITVEDVTNTIKQLTNGKAPGPDGFTAE